MAKKGKVKISKVKRNNQTTNRMKKQGKLKLQRHKHKIQKQTAPQQQPQIEYSSESEPSADEWADMLDEEEQQYIATRIAKQPQLLSHVPQDEKTNKSRKRKREKEKKGRPARKPADAGTDSGAQSESGEESELEDKYELEMAERPPKRMKQLLPIKTKEGVMERTEEVEDTDSDDDRNMGEAAELGEEGGGAESEQSDSGMEGTGEEGDTDDNADNDDDEGFVTAVQLAAARRDRLRKERLRIGSLCSSLLESPEKKLKNLFPILYLMEERLSDGTLNLHSVRKLATVSACEVLRDILPEYPIRHQDYSGVKLKKETLALYKYEKELLEFYKRYLQRVEKASMALRKRKGDRRKMDEPTRQLGLLSLKCMCNMLATKPQFNYATNIAQSVVPFLDSREQKARETVTECCIQVFTEDRKGDITLAIVRLINQLSRRRGERLHPEALRCLLSLKIRDVDLDAEAEITRKKKEGEKHKKRIVNLSKKEKKRQKKLKEVERELLETEAQESEAARRKQLTEVVKTVFHVYFRLLKTKPPPGLLAAALEGIAKFTHAINLEYYSDLVAILSRMLSDEAVTARSRLLCTRAALAVLAGAGDALNVDPAGLHAYLYAHMLDVHAGRTHPDAPLVISAAHQVSGRGRRVTAAVQAAFAKRLSALALQLHHNGALACLAIVRHILKNNKAVSSILEADPESGWGRYDALAPSPEHCGALGAALHDLCALRSHYHPLVRSQAAAILSGEGGTEQLDKMSPVQIFEEYDGSELAFKPAVPPPKAVSLDRPVAKSAHHVWSDHSLRDHCDMVDKSVDMTIQRR